MHDDNSFGISAQEAIDKAHEILHTMDRLNIITNPVDYASDCESKTIGPDSDG